MEPLRIPQKVGLDFFTLCLALLAAPGIDLDKVKPVIPSSVFISGSHGAKHTNFFALLQQADQIDKIDISATGGVQGWEDIVEYILYGASSVQIQTLFMIKGFEIIEEMKRKISNWMDEKGYSSIKEMRGAVLPEILSYNECIGAYGSTKDKVVAAVDEDKCTGCGTCLSVCIYDALKLDEDSVKVISEKCEGCRICVCACPESALSLTGVEAIYNVSRAQT
jgi:dihydropyrimidine dehydrogenase (NAD+) subunit PreA